MKQKKEKLNKKLIENKIKILNQEIRLTTVVAILFVIIFFVIGYIEESKIAELNEKAKSFQQPTVEQVTEKEADLADSYQKEARNILIDYYAKKEALIVSENKISKIPQEILNSWLKLIGETKNSLLDLVVPASYKNLHLNLILSLNAIERGILTSDDNKIEAGEKSLESLSINYPWLK